MITEEKKDTLQNNSKWRVLVIPDHTGKPIERREKIALLADLKNIKTFESNEEMINLSKYLKKDCICMNTYENMREYTGDDIWLRKSLAEKLKKVSERLKEINPDLILKIFEGYRHPKIQQDAFNNAKADLRKTNIEATEDELGDLAHVQFADPRYAGHPTGGAVDLTITDSIQNLDMGSLYDDFSDPEVFKTFSEKITPEQLQNRMLLLDLMLEQGFAPYYGEWWHFSYGDKEWAWFYQKHNAFYDQIEIKKV